MKFASYLKNGHPVFGLARDNGLVTLTGKIAGIETLRSAIEAGALGQLNEIAKSLPLDENLSSVTWLPIIPEPSKILCVGANYRDHAAEMGNTAKAWPGFFIRIPDSFVGHEAALEAPVNATDFDFEGELAAIIGKPARNIREEQALDHVIGYTILMDGSLRDFQKRCISAGKNFQSSGSSGPFMLTADKMPDPEKFVLTTWLNGEQMQHAGLDLLIHSLPKTIAYLSTIVQLRPGDIISTGSPAGVGQGRKPPLWMKAGDRITVEVSGIGRLSNPIVAGPPLPT